MSAAHTPGPWEARRQVFARGPGWDIFGDGQFICRIMEEHDDGATDAANARLIAAAPLLIEALQTVLFAVTADARANDGRVDCLAVAALVREALRDAGVTP